MVRKNWAGNILAFFSALILIVVILLTTIEFCAFDRDFFRLEYKKLGQTEVIGISEQELIETTEVLLEYIKGNRDNLSVVAVIQGEERPVFNQREIAHMADVQQLYGHSELFRNAGAICLMIFLLFLRWLKGKEFWRLWAVGYLWGAGIFFALSGLLAFFISRDFLAFWHSFHRVFFSNDLWLLNPETDILIQIVPEQFFLDLVVRILTIFTAIVIALACWSVVILWRNKVRLKKG